MKILIDINHPAHVHYFRNFIELMKKEGHEFIITNRDQSIINELLDHYNIDHYVRGKRPMNRGRLKSIMYLFSMISFVFKKALKTKPDFFIGFASPACAINGFIFRKPSIIIDDTEHNNLNHFIYSKFCSTILTPHFFEKDMGRKHIRFKAYVEQFYLHSTYFTPQKILKEKQYALVRYISYDASHDHNVKGIASNEMKKKLVNRLSEKMKVYVSRENTDDSDEFFEQYSLSIHPSEMHSVIANASVFISEGATMASEAGVLGTSYYYINPLIVGYINHQVKEYDHAHMDKIENLIANFDNLSFSQERDDKSKIESNSINPTQFLMVFVDNYKVLNQKFRRALIDQNVMNEIKKK